MDVADEILRVRRDALQLRSADEVRGVVADMASRIDARLVGENPVILAVMHGGVFTAVNLCQHFDFAYEFAYVHASRYGDRLQGGEIDWRVHPDRALAGRTVLIVDDVLDRGVTLTHLRAALRKLGVAALYIAVLVDKDVGGELERPDADFVGIRTGDVFVFGCGMDYKGYWRGLPALYAVAET